MNGVFEKITNSIHFFHNIDVFHKMKTSNKLFNKKKLNKDYDVYFINITNNSFYYVDRNKSGNHLCYHLYDYYFNETKNNIPIKNWYIDNSIFILIINKNGSFFYKLDTEKYYKEIIDILTVTPEKYSLFILGDIFNNNIRLIKKVNELL